MNPNYPGGDPSYPGNPNPNNPPTNPQQPQPMYGQQPGVPPQPDYGQQPPPYQPPVYNQVPPPYGQPQYPQYPQYPQQPPQYPQQQPPKKSNKGWIIGCSIAAVVVLLACGGIFAAVVIAGRAAGAQLQSTGTQLTTVSQVTLFCTAFESQDYGSAYQLLSSAQQGRISQADFSTHAAALDTSDGEVTTCTIETNHPLPTISSDGKTATAQMQVARGSNANLATGTVKLVLEDGVWKIDSADASLKLL